MLPREIPVRPGLVLPSADLRWRYSRSSGPGGQSVNTSDSRVELSFDVAGSPALSPLMRQRALARLGDRLTDGVLTIAASEQRSQLRNREAALDRLVEVLRVATAPPPRSRRPTRPSRGAVERRLQAKKQRSATKRHRRPPED
ncbi:alternative ribosome rescue aminoacyl-tRNA hydrolase ArfB [Candidatus Frankia alpina]|uniref:Aminoacyl-tRNA hydrolase n=1 Tax=Candidatus Frankia alpina TaxID=2699483 RepID=A0A4S5EVB6_9ACTN|nr:alternative ribosome rescue aminoacyl-tRNA hydrolase ArfB [Candidatus Frankia alpina]THJ76313.1 aminoacyl-tRNA hydrolase [Candidatus Frankia alpina]